MNEPRLAKVFDWWAGVVTRRPVLILLVAILLAVGSLFITVQRWKFQSDRNLLISQKLDWNRRFIDTQHHFGGAHDLYVVVDAGPNAVKEGSPERRAAEAAVEDLGPILRSSPYVKDAVWKAEFSPRALRLDKMESFRKRVAEIEQAKLMLESPTPDAMIGNISRSLLARQGEKDADEAAVVADLHGLNGLLAAMAQGLGAPLGKPLDFGRLMDPSGEAESRFQYLRSPNSRLLFVRVTPRTERQGAALDALATSLKSIRATIAEVAKRHQSPVKVEMGATGIEVMEADETTVVDWDSKWTGALAALGVLTLLVLAFHSFKTPMLLMAALLCGIACSYGYLFLRIGHLQVLSVFFNIMLLGLGVAYGIYLASAFELIRHDYPDNLEGFRQTLSRSFSVMGPGIITGALTTAAAFGTTVFTNFTGVAEMGEVAGVGVLLCLLAMFAVFPSLLRLLKPAHRNIASMEDRYVHFFEERWAMPFVRHPKLTLVVSGALTILAAVAVSQMRFDYDLLKLQPENTPGAQWAKRIINDGDQPIWMGLSVTKSLDDARRLAKEFRAKPTVGDVGGIGLLFPADDEQKVELLRAARGELKEGFDLALADVAATQPDLAPATPPASAPATTPATRPAASDDLIAQLTGFQTLMQLSLLGNVPPAVRTELNQLGKTLAGVAELGRTLGPDERAARIDNLTRAYRAWRYEKAKEITAATDPSTLRFEDVPIEIMGAYRSDRGEYALEIYPDPQKAFPGKKIDSPMDPRFLGAFIADLQNVDPQVTGVIVQIYNSGNLIKKAYSIAGAAAFVIVFLVVYFDFRSLRDAALILVPVGMAFIVTFGIMWLLGMRMNAANIIVLPLMFGIGVDTGIQVLNRFRQNPDEQPTGLTHGTGKGITVTCLTSVLSFAAMMLSSHRGIASLGFVLACGLIMTMLACWTVMPAWLQFRVKGRRVGPALPASSGPRPA